MTKRKRGPWSRWEIAMPLPPTEERDRQIWRESVRQQLQQQQPIRGAAAIVVAASADPAIDLPAIGGELLELLRQTGAIPSETMIADLKIKMDRLVEPGCLVVAAWRSTPPASRLSAEVRRVHRERQATAYRMLNEIAHRSAGSP